MENNEPKKSRFSSDQLVGLAAVIASIAIPLAQFLVSYFEQHAIQQQNQRLEEERRRLEITKLFMDNYVGKSADVQIATIQIMKTLDPSFFLAIEGGLKEATKSDSVRAIIRDATVEAASEISYDSQNKKANPKVKKVLSVKELEDKGYEYLKKGDVTNANKYFQKAMDEYPSHYQSTDIKDFGSFSKRSQKQMEKELQRKLEEQMKASQ